jgi:hypothetical protein
LSTDASYRFVRYTNLGRYYTIQTANGAVS